MDKKNTFLGAFLFIAAFLVLMFGQKYSRQPPTPAEIRKEVSKEIATEGPKAPVAAPSDQPTFATAQADQTGSTATKIGNSFIEVSFTNFGGAIRDVAFKKYPAVRNQPEPFIFNELHANPMLAFVGYPGLDRATRYDLVSRSDREVVYRTVLENRIEVTRHYIISPDKATDTDPYLVRCETTLRNLTDKAAAPMRVAFSIGTAAPSSPLDTGLQLTTEFSNGKDQVLVRRSELEASSGFFGYGQHGPKPQILGDGPVAWASVKNQFFAAILTPDDPAAGLETRRIKLLQELPDTDRKAYGITGDVDFDVPAVPAHGETTLGASLYVGPKEYPRLSNQDVFKKDQDRIMDLGSFVFRFCGGILLTVMAWMHRWTSNWGVAIVLTTLGLKVLLLPLTITQARSSRRMQKIMPEMKLVREKYKDNPQKQQTAMMELYKQHKVNPLGGCLPMLFTLPFFYAFFRMLQSASELRFAPFLWAHDLSGPDTVARITLPVVGSFPINIMPIIVVATIAIQMRLTPQPTVDNAQMKMMKFMPFFMLLIYYPYSCALSLYSTVNGLCIIAQQLIVNRSVDTSPVASVAPGRPGKPTKNVTPAKALDWAGPGEGVIKPPPPCVAAGAWLNPRFMTDDVQARPAHASESRHLAGDDVGIVQPRDFAHPGPFTFKSGQSIQGFTLRYETYGVLNATRDNAILVCHALSGDHHCAGWHSESDSKPGWWNNLIGPGKALDTRRFFVVCANVLGGCQGSTGPSSNDPATGTPYGIRFPFVTVRDMVNSQKLLLDHLGVAELHAVIGGSMGGMTAMMFAMEYPQFTRRQIIMASTANESAQAIAFNEVGRQAIMQDTAWNNGDYARDGGPRVGLAIARMMAHITYLSDAGMDRKFGRRKRESAGGEAYTFDAQFEVESYLRHQGQSFINRFDANSYLYITRAIDQFDPARASGLPRARLCARKGGVPGRRVHERLAVPAGAEQGDRARPAACGKAGQLRGALHRPRARLVPPRERRPLCPRPRVPRARRDLRLRFCDLTRPP